MAKKMLIDARHFEEMRMAITDGTRLENFEIESFNKKQLKGNIYLAKVMRVEPSLQAAFVEFGGNRQGFLSFAEIHPDYYQIPVADRLLLEKDLEKEASTLAQERVQETDDSKSERDDVIVESLEIDNSAEQSAEDFTPEMLDPSEQIVDEDLGEDTPRRFNLRSRYRIQEVIKRGQVMLVQVVREERGGKGAALTTYLSLPGRYCVLMPNSGERRGGISRKITDTAARKRLRGILDSFDLLEGMSLIVRTAGSDKNKMELKKDFEYLLRLWADIREKTLQSIAPTIIYAEGDLIKRALRDTYTKEIDQILIEGDEAYKTAKAFMKTVSPSHAKKVQQHKDKNVSLFQKYHVDDLVDQILSPSVELPSGGSLVITPTEALVSIDVNSGKSTRERNIEETAVKTNVEAAKEIGRQLRLRDLAGIIVIDFIDMRDSKHNAQVERALKESISSDRARFHVGRISQFGLLEMSRQRLRSSVIESNTHACPHCHGAGVIRSVESMGLFLLRKMENIASQHPGTLLTMAVYPGVEQYLLNQKRRELFELEEKYTMTVLVHADHHMKHVGYHFTIKDKATHDIVFTDDGRSLIPSLKHYKTEHTHRVRSDEDDRGNSDEKRETRDKSKPPHRRKKMGQEEGRTPRNQATPIEAPPKEEDATVPSTEEVRQVKKSRRRRRKPRTGEERSQTAQLQNNTVAQTNPTSHVVVNEVTVATHSLQNDNEPVGSAGGDLGEAEAVPAKENRPRNRRRHRRVRSPQTSNQALEGESARVPQTNEPSSAPLKSYDASFEGNIKQAANTQQQSKEKSQETQDVKEGSVAEPSKKKRKGLWERLFDS